MSIFKKKLNAERDYLSLVFDKDMMCYVYKKVINGKICTIDYTQLDRSTKKKLIEKNDFLAKNRDLLAKELENVKKTERRKFLESKGYHFDSFQVLSEIDRTESPMMKNYLDDLLSDENSLIGIHRAGAYVNEDIINDVLENGLIMTGHSGSGSFGNVELEQNVSYYPSNETIRIELKGAEAYKNSKGSFLIKIPDELLNSDDLYISDEKGLTRLNPKYIVGYVPVKNEYIDTIVENENFMKSQKIR